MWVTPPGTGRKNPLTPLTDPAVYVVSRCDPVIHAVLAVMVTNVSTRLNHGLHGLVQQVQKFRRDVLAHFRWQVLVGPEQLLLPAVLRVAER